MLAEIPLEELEVIRATLNSAYHQNLTLDMAEQYRKLSGRQQASPMTKALEGALGTIEDYIEAFTPKEEEDAVAPE